MSDTENRTGAKLVVRECTTQATGPRKDTEGDRGEETGRMAEEQAAGMQARALDSQARGMLRTKPGRGEATRCMSCSDKIARWNVCAPVAAPSLTE